MSTSAALAHPEHDAHEEHHEDHDVHGHLESMAPAPSLWPIILTLTLTLVPVGTLMFIWGGSAGMRMGGLGVLVLGLLVSLVPAMGWCHSVIVDKWAGHFGETAQGNDLVMGTKLFFLSEIAIFASLFAYYFLMLWDANHADNWPMPGTPHIHLQLPAIGLVLLLISSVTCHFAETAIHGGKRGLSKSWLLLTMALGTVFLFIQGWEWGYLINHYGFITSTNTFATVFYVLTGFHGMHVMTGLIMLFLVYGRLEIGHYSPRRHFSFKAASWYWHLVDVVWIFVFVFVYCFQG
jgi:cytochrome c oxidase subunit 3